MLESSPASCAALSLFRPCAVGLHLVRPASVYSACSVPRGSGLACSPVAKVAIPLRE